MTEKLPEKLDRELRELELLSDEDINVDDMPENPDWSSGLRGLWVGQNYESLNFDIRAVANEILKRAWAKGFKPTNMWLNKATWFLYERLLGESGKLLTQARAEAWDHGPVFREIYDGAKSSRDEPISALLTAFSFETKSMQEAMASFDDDISSMIDCVVMTFGDKSASYLRKISHLEDGPWYKVWYSGRATSAGMVISPNIILATFKARDKEK